MIYLHSNYKKKLLGHYKQIHKAIEEKRCVRVNYHSIDKGDSNRVVEPLVLLFKTSNWYLYAFCRERQSLRCFKLLRIKDIEVLDEQFEEREIELSEFNDIFTDVEETEIVLKTDKEFSKFIQEYHYVTNIEEKGQDVIITIKYPINNWVYSALLGFGNKVKIISPNDVKNKIIEIIEEMSKLYI